MKRNNIGVVSSTLPFQILSQKSKDWGLKELLVPENFYNSYLKLKTYHPELKILKYSTSLKSLIILFLKLIKIKKTNNYVYFFHECGFLIFDLFIKLIKPKSHYFPQVTLNSFTEINYFEYRGKLSKLILWIPQLKKQFTFYKGLENNQIPIYLISNIKYPENVIVHKIEETLKFKKKISSNFIKKENRDVIFITSRDIVDDNYLREFYQKLAIKFIANNYKVFQKDHPRKESRLNLSSKYIENIDTDIVIESISNEFKYAVSICSTGLICFQNRAISTIYLHNINKPDLEKRKLHLKTLDLENQIFYPRTYSELFNKIKK